MLDSSPRSPLSATFLANDTDLYGVVNAEETPTRETIAAVFKISFMIDGKAFWNL